MNKIMGVVAILSILVGGVYVLKYFDELKLKEAQETAALKEMQAKHK